MESVKAAVISSSLVERMMLLGLVLVLTSGDVNRKEGKTEEVAATSVVVVLLVVTDVAAIETGSGTTGMTFPTERRACNAVVEAVPVVEVVVRIGGVISPCSRPLFDLLGLTTRVKGGSVENASTLPTTKLIMTVNNHKILTSTSTWGGGGDRRRRRRCECGLGCT
jgi:hypothetical protein